MMTTVAAIAGIFPIALGYGAGGDARQPLGLVVAGGLVISQLVTLYLTPVFYTYMTGRAILRVCRRNEVTIKYSPCNA